MTAANDAAHRRAREFAPVLRRAVKVAPIFWLALFVSIVTAILHLSIFFAIFTHGRELTISWVVLTILAAIIGKKSRRTG